MAAQDVEKYPVDLTEHVEHTPTKVSTDGEYESEFTPEETKKIIHRIDRRLVVTVGVLYWLASIRD